MLGCEAHGSLTIVDGRESGTITLKDSLTVSQNTEDTFTHNSTPRYLPKKNKHTKSGT